MATFGGITINVQTEDSGFVSQWERKKYVSRQKPIGASRENLQFGGKGNYVLKVKVYVTSASDWANLLGFENDGTARALVDVLGDSVNHASVYLMEINNTKKRSWAAEYEAEMTFERLGA